MFLFHIDSCLNSATPNSLPINDLLSAQAIYMQRYNRAKFESIQRKFKLEEEIINLAGVLAKKYGNYYYPEDLNTFNNYQDGNQAHFVEIRIEKDKFSVQFRLNYNNTKLILPENNLDAPLKIDRSRIILNINNNITESNFELEDIDVLRNLILTNEKIQQERVERFIPISQKILEINRDKKFVCEKYIVEEMNGEIILFSNSKYKMELMRVELVKKQFKIIRSSLTNDCLMHFQQLLLDLLI